MAAQPYIQSAVTELYKAISDLEQQIHVLQRDMSEHTSQLSRDMQNLEREYHAEEMLEAHGDTNATQSHALVERIRSLHDTHEHKKSEIAKVEADVHALIQHKNDFMRRLQEELAHLNTLMGLPEAH
jgi:chromosome segregation ATPase